MSVVLNRASGSGILAGTAVGMAATPGKVAASSSARETRTPRENAAVHEAEAGREAGTVRAGPSWIGRAATVALYEELALAPKPGLVSFVDNGSHDDMDARTFMRSLFSLRRYFVAIAALGEDHAPFAALEAGGIEAEGRMLAATGGVNTHRGAIFTLGLVCAAAGALASSPVAQPAAEQVPALLREMLLMHWGAALEQRRQHKSGLPGGVAARRHGLRGASDEAALGLPTLFRVAVPALTGARRRGLSATQGRIETLFTVMATLDDCNLAHRGGLAGLRHAQAAARRWLEAGGALADVGFEHARAIHRDFVSRRLSPGGSADLLAAACLVARISIGGGRIGSR